MSVDIYYMCICVLWIIPVHLSSYTEWQLVFKVATGGPFGVYDLYRTCQSLNEDNPAAQQLDNELTEHFKSRFMNTWPELNVSLVKVSVFKDNVERAFFIFNGTNSTNVDWFTGKRLVNSSYQDMMVLTGGIQHFSIRGDDITGVERRFLLSYGYAGCRGDSGWLLVSDVFRPRFCKVDRVRKATVFFSNSTTRDLYDDFEVADCLAIFVERTVQMSAASGQSSDIEVTEFGVDNIVVILACFVAVQSLIIIVLSAFILYKRLLSHKLNDQEEKYDSVVKYMYANEKENAYAELGNRTESLYATPTRDQMTKQQ